MLTRHGCALALALFSFSARIVAQPSNLSGVWVVEAPQADATTPDGENWVMVAVSGTLTLDAQGDAVTGSWKGRAPAPWPIDGSVKGNAFELRTETRDVNTTRNGEPRTLRRRWIFAGTIDGDTMTGTMRLAGDDGESPAQSFSAKRTQ
jgi:hypothetical protein